MAINVKKVNYQEKLKDCMPAPRGMEALDDPICKTCHVSWPCDNYKQLETIMDLIQEIERHHKDFENWELMAIKSRTKMVEARTETLALRDSVRNFADRLAQMAEYEGFNPIMRLEYRSLAIQAYRMLDESPDRTTG